jgi:hypothetical protein
MRKVWKAASLAAPCALLLLAMNGTAHATSVVPEIDPGMATGGLALLTGSVLLLLERIRRR